jgi:putrescine importer
VNLTLLVASVGSGMGSQLAAARMLFGMGRDNVLPKRFFAALDPKRAVPRNNVLLGGALVLIGAFAMSYQLGAELLNFGAFIGFMGVNASAFAHYWLRGKDRRWTQFVVPLAGFAVCLYIWLSLRTPAKIAGFAWLVCGAVYGVVRGKLTSASNDRP